MRKNILSYVMCLVVAMGGFSAMATKPEKILSQEDVVMRQKLLAPLAGDMILGQADAKVLIIEYSSLTCPHCADYHLNVFPMLQSKYIETGKIRYIHRDFPMEKKAMAAATLTHCVGADRYFVFLKVLFEKQSNFATSKNYLEILENIAKLGGVSGEQFQACTADEDKLNALSETRLQAQKFLDVTSTPTFFLNGELIKGALTEEKFAAVLNAELAR
jgi:protein-disulfide isomerase